MNSKKTEKEQLKTSDYILIIFGIIYIIALPLVIINLFTWNLFLSNIFNSNDNNQWIESIIPTFDKDIWNNSDEKNWNIKTVKDFNLDDFNTIIRDENDNIIQLSNIIDNAVKWTWYVFYKNWNIRSVGNYSGWNLIWESETYYENWQIMDHRIHMWNTGIDYFYRDNWEFIWSWTIEMFKSCSINWCDPYVTIRDWTDVFYYDDSSIKEIQQKMDWVPVFIKYYSITGLEMWSLEYDDIMPYSWVEYEFYWNGQIETESHYKDGEKNGPHKKYYENWKIFVDAEYKNWTTTKRDVYDEEWYLEDNRIYNEKWEEIQWVMYYRNWKPRKIIYEEWEGSIKEEYYDENWKMTAISTKNDKWLRERQDVQ